MTTREQVKYYKMLMKQLQTIHSIEALDFMVIKAEDDAQKARIKQTAYRERQFEIKLNSKTIELKAQFDSKGEARRKIIPHSIENRHEKARQAQTEALEKLKVSSDKVSAEDDESHRNRS